MIANRASVTMREDWLSTVPESGCVVAEEGTGVEDEPELQCVYPPRATAAHPLAGVLADHRLAVIYSIRCVRV